MDTQTEFVAKRLKAHVAACADVMADPLVKAALADRAAAIEVMKRWKDAREMGHTRSGATEYVFKGGVRRQAG